MKDLDGGPWKPNPEHDALVAEFLSLHDKRKALRPTAEKMRDHFAYLADVGITSGGRTPNDRIRKAILTGRFMPVNALIEMYDNRRTRFQLAEKGFAVKLPKVRKSTPAKASSGKARRSKEVT